MNIVKRQKTLIFLTFSLFLSGCTGQKNEVGDAAETRFFGMDTDISITAYGRNAEEALTDAQAKVAELEKLWSVTDENSDIYAINHSQGRSVNVSEETDGRGTGANHLSGAYGMGIYDERKPDSGQKRAGRNFKERWL